MATPETRRQLLAAVQACDDKKGEDTRILELDPADSGLADFFLITSASNDRQVVAIADEIELRLKKDFGLYATSVEGRRQGEWILLDYVDIVIHVFLAEKRAFYDIERLRKSARPLTSAELEAELKSALAEKTRAVRSATPKAVKKSVKKVTPGKSPSSKAAKSTASSQGGSTVPAKPALKKATKPAAKKAASKPEAKPKAATAKASSPKAAPKATRKASSVKTASVSSRLVQGAILDAKGAKPPIVKCEPPPEAIHLAASAASTPKRASKTPIKQAAKKSKK